MKCIHKTYEFWSHFKAKMMRISWKIREEYCRKKELYVQRPRGIHTVLLRKEKKWGWKEKNFFPWEVARDGANKMSQSVILKVLPCWGGGTWSCRQGNVSAKLAFFWVSVLNMKDQFIQSVFLVVSFIFFFLIGKNWN